MDAPESSSIDVRDQLGSMIDLLVPPRQDEMSTTEQEASQQIQAVLLNANRLMWPDGFQFDLTKAARLMHFDLRPKLQHQATDETVERVDYHSAILKDILASWHCRNQLLTIKLGLRLDDVPATARIGQDERKEIFEAKAKTLPTTEGCEVNLLTARGFRTYFEEWVIFKIDYKVPLVPAQRQIIVCLTSIKDHLDDIATSAGQLSIAAAARRAYLSRLQASEASYPELSTAGKRQDNLSKSRSTKALSKVQRMLSMASLTTTGEDLTKKGTRNKLRKKLKPTSKANSEAWHQPCSPPLLLEQCNPENQQSPCPALSALPPAPLLALEEKQLEIRKALLRESDDDERIDSLVGMDSVTQEPRDEKPDQETSCNTGEQHLDHPSPSNPESTSASNRPCAISDGSAIKPSSPSTNELTGLKDADGCTTAPLQNPSRTNDLASEQDWWRDSVFQDLEAQIDQAQAQITESAKGDEGGEDDKDEDEEKKEKKEDKEEEEEEEKEWWAEEQLTARKAEARALALSVLEGTGPYDAGSDFGEEGGARISFGA
ncbi:hypothetical protein IWZ03DRAFT_430145 [Phyllosticta citriasiana]|uniref:Uncharacterized protein n=1 Tax=Phyllosticta citriasiana TaxID=595635 RepID=A0ABR1L2Z0_9PEZI